MDNIYVNGPVSVFRLENSDKSKIVYAFGDYHYDLGYETKCDSYKSKDFVNYFHEVMMETDKNIKYDFIHESYTNVPMFTPIKDHSNREKYLGSMIRLVDKDINLDKSKKTDKNIINEGSKTFTNLRYHYLDIRSLFNEYLMLNYLIPEMKKIYYNDQDYGARLLTIHATNAYNFMATVSNSIPIMTEKYELIRKNDTIDIENDITDFYDKNINTDIYKDVLEKLSKKIFSKYDNKQIKDTLLNSSLCVNMIYNIKTILDVLKKILTITDKLNKLEDYNNDALNLDKMSYISKYGVDYKNFRNLMYDVYKLVSELFSRTMYCFANITDLYCLRRVLDKKYIKNAILYSGNAHTFNYVYTLVHDFGFTITHANNSNKSLDAVNNIIKKTDGDKYDYAFMADLLSPQLLIQCVDMGKFPKKFM